MPILFNLKGVENLILLENQLIFVHSTLKQLSFNNKVLVTSLVKCKSSHD